MCLLIFVFLNSFLFCIYIFVYYFLSVIYLVFVHFVVIYLKGEHFTPEFTKINPTQKVPVIDDNGFILTERSK